MSDFKTRFETMLKELGLKKKEFAAEVKISPQYVTKLCSGERNMSPRMADLIEEKYGYHAEWLLNGTGEPKDPVDPLEERRKALLERLSHRSEAELVAILQFLEKIEQPGDTTTLADAFELGYEAARRIREAERKEENEEETV